MRLKLTTNLGTPDVGRFGLDEHHFEGDTIDVKQEFADELLARGWATVDEAKPAPQAPRSGGKPSQELPPAKPPGGANP